MTRRGWLLFGAMGVIWGIPYLLIKVAVAELDPTTLVLIRTVIGALILLPVALLRDELRPLVPRWRWVLVYTLVEVSLPWFLLSDAERRLSSSVTGLLLGAVPLVGAVLVWLGPASARSRDRLDRRRLVGLGLGFLGVVALVGLDLSVGDILAVVEVAVVAVCYATGPIIISRRLGEAPAIGVVTASLLGTAVIYAVPGTLHLHGLPSPPVLASMLVLGAVCTSLAFIVFFALIAEAGPARATVITYVNPAVALMLGVAVLREPLTLGAVLGLTLIVLGSVLGTSRARASALADAA